MSGANRQTAVVARQRPGQDAGTDLELDLGTESSAEREPALPAWKREWHARLAAHRERRPVEGFGSGREQEDEAVAQHAGSGGRRAALVASRVAERYARAPSYGEMLAATTGSASTLNLPRGVNALWSAGGLIATPQVP